MVLITSTKGTWERTARKRSGRMLVTAPISRPPAEPPSMASARGRRSRGGECSTAAMKSVKVLSLSSILPASCQGLPRSPPPRMCA